MLSEKEKPGLWGEIYAARFMRENGYEIITANYRCRLGEIDLIAEDRDFLVFVEVKLRKSADFAEAREFVDRKKQERLKQTALLYLAQHESAAKQPRFDVIEIYAPQGTATKRPAIYHLEDAFS